jgi:two-component system sensor histidine kinase VicK
MHNTFHKEIILPNEGERLLALKRYRLLGTPAEKSFTSIAELVAEIFQTSMAMISLVDADEVSFQSNVGMDTTVGPRGQSFCSLTVLDNRVNVVEDTLLDPVVAQNPLVCDNLGLRFYAGAPLVTHDGYLIGTVCLVDTKPREFSEQDRKILQGLAKVVMEQIELRHTNLLDAERLAAVNEEQQAMNKELLQLQQEQTVTLNQLRQSERRFSNLISKSTVGIILLTGDELKIEIANNAYARLIGRSLDELRGERLFNIIPESEAYFKPIIERVRNSGEPVYLFETPYAVNVDDSTIEGYLNLVYQPYYDVEGAVTGVMVLCHDVTEQVNARHNLRKTDEMSTMAIEAAKLGSWHIEPATKALKYNQTLANIFGYEAATTMTYEQAIGQVTDEYRPLILAEIENAISEGGDYDITYQQRRFNDGEVIWLRSFGKISQDKAGEHMLFSGFVMDVTEQKEDEQRKNDFIGMASHELKTPLTSLSAYLQLLQAKAGKSSDTFTLGALQQSLKQIRKMTSMINGFLNVSRLESGKILIDRKPFDLAGLIDEAKEESADLYTSHTLVFEPVEHIVVDADRDKIGQVINNLISNAIKYSPIGTRVQVSCIAKNGAAVFLVKDEGIGIAQQDIGQLFDRYYRVQNNSNVSGFGIGLYLCAEIIHRHNGEIWVESEPGKGSSFYFSLPLS